MSGLSLPIYLDQNNEAVRANHAVIRRRHRLIAFGWHGESLTIYIMYMVL